jgi:Domain of unknown function (DUF5615)
VSVRCYLDVHVRRVVTDGLRLREVDVLTALNDGAGKFDDPELLDRATELGRVLFTHGDDLLREAKRRQRSSEFFSGVIYAHQLNITVGHCIADLDLIAKASEPEEWVKSTVFLPL